MDDLKKDYNILLYDKRGHDISGLSNSPYTINDHIFDLVALMDYLELSNAIIVGLSGGGLIAQ